MLLDTAIQNLPQVLRALFVAVPVLKYGPVVRIGPRHLSYTDPRAWKDIFGHRAGDHIALRENGKSEMFYRKQLIDRDGMDAPNILDADREEHSRLRRAVAAGFSDRSMREHEPIIMKYVDQLMRGLRRKTEMGEEVDMAATFVGHEVCRYGIRPGFRWALNKLVKWAAWDSFKQMMIMMEKKLRHRLDMDQERNDLFEGLMSKREEWNLDLQRLQSNATLIAAAGSETTASLMAGVTFHLLQNPEALEKLNKEVRSAFKSADEITIASVSRLPYLLACLNEGLRRYPPAVSNLPRDVHEGGEMIAGEWVNENTIVEIQQYAINHSSQHWRDPFAFRPERWLNKIDADLGEAKERDEKDIDGDRLDAMQTFSVGPRNCVGRNLAYAEMRVVMARMVFEFDMELSERSKNWLKEAKVYTIWKKTELFLRLTPVKR
ncbi:hypothetical protein CHGG_05325 [Chaetomium globosum CBS 148.51]|uniref:Cytochrome P450 monooxygenase n=1 Tax=Chaetomium globosum (strain ATCC 6205 / CBS 148.51 / DSM 1962 / NBRC 6347 / NRRL 1970) TaxID=306901 RepID=Q2H7P0_CHAGB|nr:uncharacterized protein CHGG_05325 [Chaetomium globosum CBS 148.51]EAQ88706.1 hypothetical protein CHGG_05325 [Chaetomium globosum CBS 148.51]